MDQCLTTIEEKAAMKAVPYQEAVGVLNWVAVGTQPDITFSTGQLQEELTIGVVDGMPLRHPPKMVGVVSECQESRSNLTKFANCRTLYQALCNKII
jgi:hypothetical protein